MTKFTLATGLCALGLWFGVAWAEPACGAFGPGVKVATPQGVRAVENLAVGDPVLSYREGSNLVEVATVRSVEIVQTSSYEVGLTNAKGGREIFMVSGVSWLTRASDGSNAWQPAEQLSAGVALTTSSQKEAHVDTVEYKATPNKLFAVRLDKVSNIIVGSGNLILQTSCKSEGSPR